MEHLFSFQLLKLSLGVVKFLYGKNHIKSFSYFTFIVTILPWYQKWTKMGTKLYINDQECREEIYFVLSRSLITYFSTSPLSGDFKHFQISFILPLFPILFLSTKFHFPSFQMSLLRPTAQISWKRNKIPFSPIFEMSYITIKRDLFFQSKFKLLPVLILVSLNHESCKFFTHEIYFWAFLRLSTFTLPINLLK